MTTASHRSPVAADHSLIILLGWRVDFCRRRRSVLEALSGVLTHGAVASVRKMGVAAVGKLVRAPRRCPRGHALRPDRTLLRTVSCSCGRHTTWRCHCGEVIYRPVLSEHCRLLNGRAPTRRAQ